MNNTITTNTFLVGGIEIRVTRDGQGVDLEEAAQALAEVQASIRRMLQNPRGDQFTTTPISDALRAFKLGDVVAYEVSYYSKGITAIAKRYNEEAKEVEFVALLDQGGHLCVEDEGCHDLLGDITKIRLATEDERKRLTDALRDERCLIWDEESKSLVRWRAARLGSYYTLDHSYLQVIQASDHSVGMDIRDVDSNRYTLGNYYPTREMAERQAQRIRAIHATPCADEQDAQARRTSALDLHT